MARRRLIWKAVPWLVVVIGLGTAAVAWYTDLSVRTFYYDHTERELESAANLAASLVEPLLVAGAKADVQPRCRTLGRDARTRITVIATSGQVLGDSEQTDPSVMDNHADRLEIREALAGKVGKSNRFSPTLNLDMIYVARPILHDGKVIGVVRTALALSDLNQTLYSVNRQIWMGGGILALFVLLLTFFIFTMQITRPLRQLQAGAARFAAGRLDQAVPVFDTLEIGSLAQTLNAMASELDEKIRTITRQSYETQAVLAGMIEGVLAVDADQRIITLNQAAARLLEVNGKTVRGKSIFEVVRNADLQRMLDRVLRSEGALGGELTLRVGEQDHLLEAHAAVLKGTEDRLAGAVVVLHDVTKLRQLERVRQEFVANVSHELKTPITAIKAAVETLIDGPESDPSAGQRFLPVIARQADRLSAIVDDLLMLARVEQEDERQKVPLVRDTILPVLQSAIETCQPKADSKGVTMKLEADAGLVAMINSALLEQAMVNLLDNAIKYCPAGCLAKVTAKRVGTEAVIAVEDNGPGIDAVHLPRLFERFYRPDKARSREVGGTGLGLSIVKHVAQAHGGSVSVESTLGRGSIFYIRLPVI